MNGLLRSKMSFARKYVHTPIPQVTKPKRLQYTAVNSTESNSEVVTSVSIGTQEPEDVTCIATGMDVSCILEVEPKTGVEPGFVRVEEDRSLNPQSSEDGILQQLLATALLVSPFFFWGTSMVAMKGVLPHSQPLFLAVLRMLPAGFALLAWGAANGRPQPSTTTAWAWIAAFALVDGAAFQGFLAEGLLRTSAGLGSVIIDSQPLTVAVLAALLFGEKLSGLGVAGLFVGVVGLLMLELPEEAVSQGVPSAIAAFNDMFHSTGSLWDSGEFWMLLAAQSMALGTVMVRGLTKHCDPVMGTAWHLVLGGVMLSALMAVQDADTLPSTLQAFTQQDAAIMSYVSMFGGAASYGIFFYNASKGNLTRLSSLTFLTPVFAAAGGFLLLSETLTSVQLLGAAVTLSAVFLINNKSSHA